MAKSAKRRSKKSPKTSKRKSRSRVTRKSVSKKVKSCSPQTTKKYTSRPSPPYPANECCGETFRGNDGVWYESVMAKNGICKWVKLT